MSYFFGPTVALLKQNREGSTVKRRREARKKKIGDKIEADALSRIVFLGTSSMAPLPLKRNVSSLVICTERGHLLMVDCGEGSQHQLKLSQLRSGRLRAIFLTHLHGDHCYGLPGLLHALKAADRSEALHVYGPKGVESLVRHTLHASGGWHGFAIVIHQLSVHRRTEFDDCAKFEYCANGESDERSEVGVHSHWSQRAAQPSKRTLVHDTFTFDTVGKAQDKCVFRYSTADTIDLGQCLPGISVSACPITHRVETFGYVFREADKSGKLDAKKAAALGARGSQMGQLKGGEDVEVSYKCADTGQTKQRTIRSADVCGAPLKGSKVAVLQDCSHVDSCFEVARDCDVVIHECTYENKFLDKALQFGHSTANMAATHAQKLNAKLLVLTHFSARYSETGVDAAAASSSALSRDAVFEVDFDAADICMVESLRREAESSLAPDCRTRVLCACDFMQFDKRKGAGFVMNPSICVKPPKKFHFAQQQIFVDRAMAVERRFLEESSKD